jgi:hypothetical protein
MDYRIDTKRIPLHHRSCYNSEMLFLRIPAPEPKHAIAVSTPVPLPSQPFAAR